MQKHLYFICPTDHLEKVIDNTFNQEHYYFTSLGNSVIFDSNRIGWLSELLTTKNIHEISFVISDDNRIVLDAMKTQDYSGITGLNNFYNYILKQEEYADVLWQTSNRQFLVLSYHLNKKIKELRLGLKYKYAEELKIDGKIYNREEMNFRGIYSELVCKESFGLN